MTRILIADDHPAIRRLIRATLAVEPDYEIIEAADGAEALELARLHRPSLAILDHEMPRLNGDDVCRALKADPATRDILLVIFTGSGGPDVQAYALTAGAAAVFYKPVSPSVLLDYVRSLLADSV